MWDAMWVTNSGMWDGLCGIWDVGGRRPDAVRRLYNECVILGPTCVQLKIVVS